MVERENSLKLDLFKPAFEFKEHPEYNLIADFAFSLAIFLGASHYTILKYFVQEILPKKKENPIEYYKESIKLMQRYG